MTRAQAQCFGYNGNFTPRGLHQHFKKSLDPRCHDARSMLQQAASVSAPTTHMASPLTLDPDHASPGSGRISPDDLGTRDYSLGRHDDGSEMDLDGHNGMLSLASGRVSPDNMGTHDYSLGAHNDMDGCDGIQSLDSGFSAVFVAI